MILHTIYKEGFRDFPGGPVAKTPCSQSRGPRFNPWSGPLDSVPGSKPSSSQASTVVPGVSPQAEAFGGGSQSISK